MKRVAVFFIFIMLVSNLTALVNAQSLDEAVKQTSVYEQYKKGGIKQAEEQYKVLKGNKNIKEEDFLALIQLYYEQGKMNKIAATAKEGVKYYPESSALYTFLGMAEMTNKNFDEAIDAYSKSIGIKPTEPAYYNRGQIYYYAKKDYNKAINDFTKALEYTDQYVSESTKNEAVADIYQLRANCYHLKSDFDKAIDDYSAAIKFSALNPDLYFNRANSKLAKVSKQKIKINNLKLIDSANEDLDIAMEGYKKNNNMKMYNKIQQYKQLQAVMNVVH